MIGAHLEADFLRLRASDSVPEATLGFSIFGRFVRCPEQDSPFPVRLEGRHLLLEEAGRLDSASGVEGVFRCLGGHPGVVAVPGERKATGVLVVLVDNLEPSREEEFNRWYDTVHVPDILSAGSFHWVTRYRAESPKSPAGYLAVYETDWEDPRSAVGAMAARPTPAALWDAIAPFHLAVYRRS